MKKSKKSERNPKTGIFGKIGGVPQKIAKFVSKNLFLSISIACVVIALVLEFTVFNDWWAFFFAVVGSIVTFFWLRDCSYQEDFSTFLSFAFCCFFVLTITTSVFGSGIGWHILGYIIGCVVFAVGIYLADLFLSLELGIDGEFGDFAAYLFITLVFLSVIECVIVFILAYSASEVEKQNQQTYFDKKIEEAPFYKVEKVFNEVHEGNTHYIILTEKDTLDFSVVEYPNARYIDTSYNIACVRDGDGNVVRLEYRKI